MKKLLLPIAAVVLLMSAVTASAQKINPAGRIILDQRRAFKAQQMQPGVMHPLASQPEAQVRALVSLNPGFTPSELTATGFVEVTADLGTICVAVFPLDRAEELAELKAVKSISFGDELKPTLDFARPAGTVSEVQNGFDYNGETLSYDGTGVVVGMMDTGLDANHVNFLGADGQTRVQRVWHFTGSDGTAVSEYTPANLSAFTTDNKNGSHATHVAGIMGGSYKGEGTVAYLSVDQAPSSGFTSREFGVKKMDVPYYGVATNADLALAVGSLTTANIVQGVSNVIEYAESQGKPAVVNLSLGSNSGPHDGSDAYSQALAALGQRGIIVMAAGNEGNENISIKKTLGSSGNDAYLRTFLAGNEADGVVDLWGSDASVITLTLGLYSSTTRTLTPIITTTKGGESLSTNGKTAFTNEFNGSVTIYSGLSEENNRYEVYMQFSGVSRKTTGTQYLAIEATSKSGNTLYLYGNSDATFSRRMGSTGSSVVGYSDGSPANSISDGCCADNVLSVGSFTTRNVWGVLGTNDGGNIYGYSSDFPVGEISPFSSYGTSFQGTRLPLVCAPGAAIVSSYSRYYVDAADDADMMTAKVTSGRTTNYWGQMQGTSMACPYVSGTVGLWLQADPSLTFGQVLDTVKKSSVAQTAAADRWGAGKIDALAGMKYVLDTYAAIGAVFEDEEQRLLLTPGSGSCNVYVAGANTMVLKLVDLQGRTLRTVEVNGDNADISTDGLTGIFVIEATTDLGRFTRKAVLR